MSLQSKSFSHHYMPQRALEEPLVLLADAEAALAECECRCKKDHVPVATMKAMIDQIADLERKRAEYEGKK